MCSRHQGNAMSYPTIMDIEKLLRKAQQAALPDPHDEREVMNAPLLRELHDALIALHRHAEAMAAELEWFDALEHETAAWAAFNYRAEFPRKP